MPPVAAQLLLARPTEGWVSASAEQAPARGNWPLWELRVSPSCPGSRCSPRCSSASQSTWTDQEARWSSLNFSAGSDNTSLGLLLRSRARHHRLCFENHEPP